MVERARRLWRRLEKLRGAVDFALARRFGLATREDRIFFLLIGGVGVVAGVLGTLVHQLIDGLRHLLWGGAPTLLAAARTAPWWLVVGAPALGGLIAGLVLRVSRQQGTGGGMGQLIEAVALTGGKVATRPIIAHALAAVATVGSGGSLGREGPMIRLGAMMSSWMGSRLGLPAHRLKILVGCGAAAGLAAAYNIPVGGALFAMEVILGNFALEIFGPVVASSVISTLISRALQGDLPRYPAEGFQLESGWEILLYVGLGVLGALLSVIFVRTVALGRSGFARLRFVPPWLRTGLGMALLGVLALEVPQVLGGGYEVIHETLAEEGLGLQLLLVLALAKLLATALTAGCGGSGGLFTPSLTVGALFGGAYGHAVHAAWPSATASYGAYGAVGMAAVAAGTSHAPISAILILFELTGNYELILPLMVAAITASLLSRRLTRASIYTESLRRRGIDPRMRMEEAVLAGLSVGDLQRADSDTLRPADPYRRVVERFLATHRQRLFVIGDDGRVLGAVSLHDIKGVLDSPGDLTMVVAHDLLTPVPLILRRSDRLHRVAQDFSRSDYERLPVVDDEDRFTGVLAKRDLLAVYAQEVLGRPAMLATFVSGGEAQRRRDYVELPPDFALRLVPAPRELWGRPLAAARLPQTLGVQVLEIKRRRGPGEEERVIPHGETMVERGDLWIALGPTAAVEAMLEGRMPPPVAGGSADDAGGGTTDGERRPL